jgi:hypothetical protein
MDGHALTTAVADAGRMLTDRHGVDPSHVGDVLAAIASERGVSLQVLAAQLTGQSRR